MEAWEARAFGESLFEKSSAKTFNILGCSSSEAGFFAPAELKKSPTVVSS